MKQDLQTKIDMLEHQNKELIKNNKINNITFNLVLGAAVFLSGLSGYKLKSIEQNYSLYQCREQVRNLQMNIHRADLNYSYEDSLLYELVKIR